MADTVFLSYSHSDEDRARAVRDQLAAAGLECWFAPADLVPAAPLPSIADKIASARYVVVLLSPVSATSPWVLYEAGTALSLQLAGKPLEVIPARIADVEMPPALAGLSAIDLRPPDFTQGMDRLIARLRGQNRPTVSPLEAYREFVAGPQGPADPADRRAVLDWTRQADGELLDLALYLWRDFSSSPGQRGITASTLAKFLLRRGVSEDRVRAGVAVLASRAGAAALLEPATERPRGGSRRDAQVNPSYDYGPLFWLVGPSATAWAPSRATPGGSGP